MTGRGEKGMEIKTIQRARAFLLVGLTGACLTLIGDLLIGYIRFPEGAGMLEGYFAAALALPVWRPIVGGLIGFLGISLEFFGLMTFYPLLKTKRPAGAAFYKLSMYVYLAVAGGAVHLPCGVFMWLYHSVADAAGQEAGYRIALQYVLYFMLPATVLFFVFFVGSSAVQFLAVIRGDTPFPRWYALFNLLLLSVCVNALRRIGNYAVINGIGTSNKSLGAIIMFIALYIGFGKYVRQEDLQGSCGQEKGCTLL